MLLLIIHRNCLIEVRGFRSELSIANALYIGFLHFFAVGVLTWTKQRFQSRLLNSPVCFSFDILRKIGISDIFDSESNLRNYGA